MADRAPRAVAALIVGLLAAPAAGQEIAIGLGRSVTSIDPHFHNTGPNNSVATHIYDRLIHHNERQREKTGLALAWKALDATTWEFALRRGVSFHDGSPFGADDVVASFRRAPEVPNSPSSFGLYTRAIVAVEKVDEFIVRLRTRAPHPLLPNDASSINIVNRRFEKAATAEFDSGRAAIGTGPYRVERWVKDDRLVLSRHDAWWGGPTAWARATLRVITSDPSRVAALLAGDVHAIEAVPTADLRKLETMPSMALSREVSNRLLFLNLDHQRDVSPFLTDHAGRPLDRNPLRDLRVRRAISKAINRAAIAERLQEGLAIPAGGVIPAGFFGGDPALLPDAFDPDGARRLLAEAGWPDGFGDDAARPQRPLPQR